MARIRLNNEYRTKIANRMRVHLEQEDTQEKRKYDKLKGEQVDINDMAWSVAEKIVRRHYTPSDVEKAAETASPSLPAVSPSVPVKPNDSVPPPADNT